MKEFDLEAAVNGAPVFTRDGRQVTIFVINDQFIGGTVDGRERKYVWSLDGRFFGAEQDDEKSQSDLMMGEKTQECERKPTETQVDHPSHYNAGKIECIDAMVAAFGMEDVETFCRINTFKYLWRANHKGHTREDLEKARWYLDKSLQLLNE